MAATSPSANVPSPTQNGLTADCSRFYNVKDGDYCASIVNMYRTFTLDDFYGWNPAVRDDCSGLIAGYYVCVGVPGTPTSAPAPAPTPTGPQPTQTGIEDDCTTYYQVQSGDYCQGIVDMYGTFSLSDFYSWNPAVGTDCSHLQVGYYVCVGVPGTPATRVTTSTTPTPTGPSPTQSGIATDCTKYYQAVSGDSCAVIADKFGTFNVAEFEEWNPAVQSDCSKLFLGYYYCIAVPGTPTHRSSSSAVSPTPTLSGPQPQQPGIVQNCDDYYLVNSGDYCYAIEQSQGISADDFFKWNTGLNKDCSNLFSGYYVCVGVS